MTWVKIGDIQKGKIFTVYSGESFDLKWYTDNVEWRNPVVIAQVSSMFFDRMSTVGFKANLIYHGGTSYTAQCLSNGITDANDSYFNDWMLHVNRGGDPNAYGGGRVGNGQRHYKGHLEGYRGHSYMVIHDRYDYFNSYGYIVIRIGETEISRTQINRKSREYQEIMYTPYLTGNLSIALEGANIPSTMYIIKDFKSAWEVKSGILTIFANDSNGVGY